MNMNNDIVTTNLRLPRQDWLMIKTLAAEKGESFNEYVKRVLFAEAFSVKKGKNEPKKLNMGDLGKVLRLMKDKPMEASEDDKIIYGIED